MQPLYRLGDAVTGPLGQNDVPPLVPERYAGPVNGTLLDVIGPARAWGDFNFVPARIELRRCGASGESSQRFPQSKFAVHGVEIYGTAAASELRKRAILQFPQCSATECAGLKCRNFAPESS